MRLLKKEKRYRISEKDVGIYYIEGGMFPTQLIVTRLIKEEENFWIHNLTNELKTKEKVYREYQKHKNEKLYKSVMEIIVKANRNVFDRRDEEMCQALFDIYKEDLMEMAMKEARKEIAKEVKEKQKLDIINLMKNANFTLEQAFEVLMVPEEERKMYNLG